MFDTYFKPMIERYERVLMARLLLYGVLLGGGLVISVTVCVALMLTFPDYRWYVLLGLVVIWLLKTAVFYGYLRVVLAEQRAQAVAERQQLDNTIGLVTSSATLIMDLIHQLKKKR